VSEGTRQSQGPVVTDEGFSATVAAITSAFGDSTRRQIYLFARERQGVTATEVAEHFALHPNVARHHLDKLAAGGYLDVYVDRGNAGVGRPSKRYLSGAGNTTAAVPALRDDLLLALLGRLLTIVDPVQAEQIATKWRGVRPLARLANGARRRTEITALGHAIGGPRVDRTGIRRTWGSRRIAQLHRP